MSYSTSNTKFFDESTDESVIAEKCAKDYIDLIKRINSLKEMIVIAEQSLKEKSDELSKLNVPEKFFVDDLSVVYVFTMDVEEGFVSKVEEVGSLLGFVFGEKNG